MAITRWDPFGEMTSMQREMERLFSRLGMAQAQGGDGERTVAWLPRVDVKRQGDDMIIRAELPGMKPEDVDISLTDNVLTIKGERKREQEKENEGYIVREMSYGSFERSVMVPEDVKPEDIRADFTDGILEVTVPKAMAETKPKSAKIPIGARSR